MKILRFGDVEAWQEGRVLSKMVYRVSNRGEFSKDFQLRDQIRSAAISVISNIAEGFDSGSRPEFARFLGYARRSTSEIKFQLYVPLDNGYITSEEFDELYEQATRTAKLINGFIKYLVSKKPSQQIR